MERRGTMLILVLFVLVSIILLASDSTYSLQFRQSETAEPAQTEPEKVVFEPELAAYAFMETLLPATVTVTETLTSTMTKTSVKTEMATATTTITATISEEEIHRECKIRSIPGAEPLPIIVQEPLPVFLPPSDDMFRVINTNLLSDRTLVTAVVNNGMIEYTFNWIASLNRTNVHKFVVFCIDSQAHQALVDAGYGQNAVLIPKSWYHREIPSAKFEEYKEGSYYSITHAKTLVVERLLHLNIIVVFSDVDVVWLSPYVLSFLSSMWETRDETLMLFSQEGFDRSTINSGFYLMRPSSLTKRVIHDTVTIQDAEPMTTQQQAMNRALLKLDLNMRTSPLVLLDLYYFPNGLVIFRNEIPMTWSAQPLIAHANYFVGNEKKDTLKRFNMWYIDS
ncbi:nucleotide-diphospho-sugar transferase-domain-containing protein [Endogone sp. FLAS-F59071]|nr:nucleotide-diphospho-sugar transferase-domain-containing protein [Endogone sp. FLAS-F59071]|eukprot:RUS20175.1 nucleotide-diphospho-sugar transferase-domain-containing protein [Endogone sp. FLAS-F59071]